MLHVLTHSCPTRRSSDLVDHVDRPTRRPGPEPGPEVRLQALVDLGGVRHRFRLRRPDATDVTPPVRFQPWPSTGRALNLRPVTHTPIALQEHADDHHDPDPRS